MHAHLVRKVERCLKCFFRNADKRRRVCVCVHLLINFNVSAFDGMKKKLRVRKMSEPDMIYVVVVVVCWRTTQACAQELYQKLYDGKTRA